MARKRFKPYQNVAILREAEQGANRQTLFRKLGICEQTFYRSKRMYGGLGVSDLQSIKALGDENRKLKQLAWEQALVIETLKKQHQKRGRLNPRPPRARMRCGASIMCMTAPILDSTSIC